MITGKESLSATYATIAPGESVEYSFVVVPKKSGSFPGGAVSVSYLGTKRTRDDARLEQRLGRDARVHDDAEEHLRRAQGGEVSHARSVPDD